MSSKMRYGPRFANTLASARYQYNENADLQDYTLRKHLAFMHECQMMQPKYKQELRQQKAAATNRRRNAKNAPGPEREEAEQRMAEAVRKVVEILEFHMEDMIQHRQIQGRHHYCNQIGIHNVIVLLRQKCGVRFDPNPEYDHTVHRASEVRTPEQWKNDLISEREQQRLSRLRNMKAIAERLIARPKTKATGGG